jgi:hypothetical protein
VLYLAGDGPLSAAVGDLDGDGDRDLAVANLNSDNVSVLLNNGDGTFAAQVLYGAGDAFSVAVGDLDGDGDRDLAVANRNSDNVSVLLHVDGDCNGNGVPDDCDINEGTSNDCNGNGVPDECDTASGNSDGDGDDDGVCDSNDLCPNTIPGAPVDADGCPSPAIPADFDNDGDVDGDDVDAFIACATRPGVAMSPGCEDKDFDNDTDGDLYDFAVVQLCYSGQNNPGDPDCAD